jgi:hypothetical protein
MRLSSWIGALTCRQANISFDHRKRLLGMWLLWERYRRASIRWLGLRHAARVYDMGRPVAVSVLCYLCLQSLWCPISKRRQLAPSETIEASVGPRAESTEGLPGPPGRSGSGGSPRATSPPVLLGLPGSPPSVSVPGPVDVGRIEQAAEGRRVGSRAEARSSATSPSPPVRPRNRSPRPRPRAGRPPDRPSRGRRPVRCPTEARPGALGGSDPQAELRTSTVGNRPDGPYGDYSSDRADPVWTGVRKPSATVA